MSRTISEEQLEALKEKYNTPDKKVICPVCHTPLERGTSKWGLYVGCETCRVYGGLRGF